MQGVARFELTEQAEEPVTEGAQGWRITRGRFVSVYSGDLEGEGVLAEVTCYGPDKTATIVGYERFAGRLGDRVGGFVLEHRTTFDGAALRATRTIVAGSGTGELAGVTGEFLYAPTPQERFTLALDYDY